jgi:hypothetical protein
MLQRAGGNGPTGPYNWTKTRAVAYDAVAYVVVHYFDVSGGQQAPEPRDGGDSGPITVNDLCFKFRVHVCETRYFNVTIKGAPLEFVRATGRDNSIAGVTFDSATSQITVHGRRPGRVFIRVQAYRYTFPYPDETLHTFYLIIEVVECTHEPEPGREWPADKTIDSDGETPVARIAQPDSGATVSGDVAIIVTQDNVSKDAVWTGFRQMWSADLPDSLLGGVSSGFAGDSTGADGWTAVWDTDDIPILDGEYYIQVAMQDSAGNADMAEIPVTVQNELAPEEVSIDSIAPFTLTGFEKDIVDSVLIDYPGDPALVEARELILSALCEYSEVTWLDDWRLDPNDGEAFFYFQMDTCDSLNSFLRSQDPLNEGHETETFIDIMKGMMYIAGWEVAMVAIEDAEAAGGDPVLLTLARIQFNVGVDSYYPRWFDGDPPQYVWDSEESKNSINAFRQAWVFANQSRAGVGKGWEGSRGVFSLGQILPNPTPGSMRFSLSVPGPGHARVILYDIAGAKVRTLFDGFLHRARSHSVKWDGILADGGSIPPGIYFVGAEFAGQIRTRKVVVIR